MHEVQGPGVSLPMVVLIHFGPPDHTRRCLDSLREMETQPHAVVVVDHGPLPGLGQSLAGSHSNLRVLSSLHNPGFGAGCNAGARLAFDEGADAVWFLNNDARLEAPLLETFLAQSLKHPQVALWGTRQRNGTRLLGSDHQPRWYGKGLRKPEVEGLSGGQVLNPRESLSGASIFITRASWNHLGPWPESNFLYFEDTAWCLQAHQAGLPMVLLDNAVLHSPGTTTGRHSPLTIFYGTRNRLRLQMDTAGTSWFGLLWETTYLLQRRLFRGDFRALRPVLDGCLAAFKREQGRNRRY